MGVYPFVCLSVSGSIWFACMSTGDGKFRDNAVAAVAGNSIFCFSPAVTATAAVEVAASSSSSSSSAKLKYVPALPQSGHIRPVVPLEPLSLLNPAATSAAAAAAAAAAVADITSSSSTNSGLKFDPGLIKEEPGVTVSKSSVTAAISKRSADLTTDDDDVEQQTKKAPRAASMSAATSKDWVDLVTSDDDDNDDDDVEPQRKKAPRAAVAPRLKCPCFNVKDNVHCRLQGLHSAHEMRQEHHAQWGCFKGSCSAKLHHSCLKSYNPCLFCLPSAQSGQKRTDWIARIV